MDTDDCGGSDTLGDPESCLRPNWRIWGRSERSVQGQDGSRTMAGRLPSGASTTIHVPCASTRLASTAMATLVSRPDDQAVAETGRSGRSPCPFCRPAPTDAGGDRVRRHPLRISGGSRCRRESPGRRAERPPERGPDRSTVDRDRRQPERSRTGRPAWVRDRGASSFAGARGHPG